MPSVREIQTALDAKGFSPGAIDNAWGPMTSGALARWQKANGLSPSGQPEATTLAKLLGGKPPQPIIWLDEATRLMGLREGPGAADNPKILDWADNLDIHYPADSVAWCGLFVAHVIRTALPAEPIPTNPLGARNWGKFGVLCEPQVGAVATFWRGSRDGWQGHVGLLTGQSKTAFRVRGGNQSDSVSDAWIGKDRLLATRWPLTGGAPLNIALPSSDGGRLSTNEA